MPIKIKSKVSVKKEMVIAERKRLRLRDWMMFWILVLANVALVASIFGKVDVRTLRPVGMVNEQNSSEEQLIDELRDQVRRLGDQVAVIGSAPEPDSVELYGMDGACPAGEAAPIDNYLTYKLGDVSVQVPYSTGWTNPKCQLSPATVSSDGEILAFGPALTDVHISKVNYGTSLTISKEKTTIQSIRETIAKPDPNGGTYSAIRERTINGMPTISYSYGIDNTVSYWVAIGRNYTYTVFSQRSWLTDAEAIKIIQSLRVTK